jgi:hypothetical protein
MDDVAEAASIFLLTVLTREVFTVPPIRVVISHLAVVGDLGQATDLVKDLYTQSIIKHIKTGRRKLSLR